MGENSSDGGGGVAVLVDENRAPVIDRDAVFKEGYLDMAKARVDLEKSLGRPIEIADIIPIGQSIATTARNINWWYGDLLLFAEEMFNENYAQLLDPRGLSQDYYSQIASVAKAYAPHDRLIPTDDPKKPCDGVPWSLHREADRVDDHKRRQELLWEAMERNWSYRDMIAAVKKAKALDVGEAPPGGSKEPTTSSQTITITVERSSAGALESEMAVLKTGLKRDLLAKGIRVTSVSTKESGALAVAEEEPPPVKKTAASKKKRVPKAPTKED